MSFIPKVKSPHQQHSRTRLRHTHHQHLGHIEIADMQVCAFLQGNSADAFGLELGQFSQKVWLVFVCHTFSPSTQASCLGKQTLCKS